MKPEWTNKWKKCLIWFSGYFSFIAYAVVGGYVVIKGEDKELKKTAKTAFVVTLIFACLSAFLSLFYNFGGMSESFYASQAYAFYDIFSKIVNVARIVVFAVFIIIELAKKETPAKVEESKAEEPVALDEGASEEVVSE